jgi:hypothetical protein
MFCPSCGKEIPDDSRYCLVCGKSPTAIINEVPKPKQPSQTPRNVALGIIGLLGIYVIVALVSRTSNNVGASRQDPLTPSAFTVGAGQMTTFNSASMVQPASRDGSKLREAAATTSKPSSWTRTASRTGRTGTKPAPSIRARRRPSAASAFPSTSQGSITSPSTTSFHSFPTKPSRPTFCFTINERRMPSDRSRSKVCTWRRSLDKLGHGLRNLRHHGQSFNCTSAKGRSGRRRQANTAPNRSSAVEPMNGNTQLPVRSTR